MGSMTVLKVGEVLHLYYEAWGVHSDNARDYSSLQIGHATSRDGLLWTKDTANPVLPKGTGSAWDRDGTWDPFVLYEDGVVKMWYGGGMDQHCDAEPIKIGGLDAQTIYKFTHVIQNDGQWEMFFGKFVRPGCEDSSTGFATSPDGLHWTARNTNLLVGIDGEVLRLADDLWMILYGRDGFFDQAGQDIRIALYRGKLADLATKQ